MLRCLDKLRNVLHELYLHTGREVLGQSLCRGLYIMSYLSSIGTGTLRHHHHNGRMSVKLGEHGVIERTHLYLCHILYTEHMAKVIGLYYHIAELFRSLQTASVFH